MQSAQDRSAYLKLAQVYRCLNQPNADESIIEKICKKEGNNNFQLPSNTKHSVCSEDSGNTILHFVAAKSKEPQTLDILLNNGVDITIKNRAGLTPLHYIFEDSCRRKNITWLLEAHIKSNNFSNPRNNDGLSHCHIACIANKIEVVEFFLKNGVSIDHTVNADSDFGGFTPLHLAVQFCNLEAVQILLKNGADVYAKDAKGMTPLHILIERKMCIYDDMINKTHQKYADKYNDLMKEIEKNEMITDLLLQKNAISDAAFFDNVGLSRFHIACTMQDSWQAEGLLNDNADIYQPVPANSSIWPGYTALHFAANCNLETVKVLMTRGANIETKDANGVTPFDICLSKLEIQDVCTVMSYKLEYKHIQFSQSKMKLLSLLSAVPDTNKLSRFLKNQEVNVSIPRHAPLWPGYTPLHLAVVFSGWSGNEQSVYWLVEECLSRGADVTVRDAHGSTPLHLAFKMKRKRVVERLLKAHRVAENPVDEDGLSHLHIACAAECTEVVEQLANKENINVAYTGKTIYDNYQYVRCEYAPLHIAVVSESVEIVKILLNKGADINQFDAAGRTAVHAALGRIPGIGFELLKSTSLRNCVMPGVNLSHLHVACRANSLDAVEKLIGLGADVNAAVVYDDKWDPSNMDLLPGYRGWTPLHFAVVYKNLEIAKMLVERGADVLAESENDDVVGGKNRSGFTPLSFALTVSPFRRVNKSKLKELFIRTIYTDNQLRKRMEQDSGITMLHLACCVVDLEAVKILLDRKVNVNARVHENSAIWPGCTSLHVLLIEANAWWSNRKLQKTVDEIVRLLLGEGADVTLANDGGDTPIHTSFQTYKLGCKEIFPRRDIDVPENSRVKVLMKGHENFKVNPVNREGISHFLVAVAINDLDAAEKFLKEKVDVNQATNYFNGCAAGYTPLHYAIDVLSCENFTGSTEFPMLKLLLEHGADANVEDVFGNTPLHLAARANAPYDLLKMLVRYGANRKTTNVYSQEPFDLMLQ